MNFLPEEPINVRQQISVRKTAPYQFARTCFMAKKPSERMMAKHKDDWRRMTNATAAGLITGSHHESAVPLQQREKANQKPSKRSRIRSNGSESDSDADAAKVPFAYDWWTRPDLTLREKARWINQTGRRLPLNRSLDDEESEDENEEGDEGQGNSRNDAQDGKPEPIASRNRYHIPSQSQQLSISVAAGLDEQVSYCVDLGSIKPKILISMPLALWLPELENVWDAYTMWRRHIRHGPLSTEEYRRLVNGRSKAVDDGTGTLEMEDLYNDVRNLELKWRFRTGGSRMNIIHQSPGPALDNETCSAMAICSIHSI